MAKKKTKKKSLITRTKLAVLAGVGRPAVTARCKGKLKGAVVGKFIDADHSEVVKYLKSKQNGKTPDAHNIEGIMDLTLRELVEEYGTDAQFKTYIEAVKIIADIHLKHLTAQEKRGRLIDRQMVKTHIFGLIESTFSRLLGDVPKTISRRQFAMAKAGATVAEGEALAREIISTQLKGVKATAKRNLKGKKGK